MSEIEVCNCDHSKALLERAQRAEAKLQLVHSHVRGLARRVDGVLVLVEEALKVPGEVIDSEFAEVEPAFSEDDAAALAAGLAISANGQSVHLGSFAQYADETDENERLLPAEHREDVLASGTAAANGGPLFPDFEHLVRLLADDADLDVIAAQAKLIKLTPAARRTLANWMADQIPLRSKSERP